MHALFLPSWAKHLLTYINVLLISFFWAGLAEAGSIQASVLQNNMSGVDGQFLNAIWNQGNLRLVYTNYPVVPGQDLLLTLSWTGGSASIMGVMGSSGAFPLVQVLNNGRVLREVSFPHYYVNQYSGSRSVSVNTAGLPAGPLELRFVNHARNVNIIVPGVVVAENAAPAVSNVSLLMSEDETGALGLLASDPDAGDTHVMSIVSGPSVGSASLAGNTLRFSPPANWAGTTSLQYRATDSKGAVSNVGTVNITVHQVNDAPAGVPTTLNTSEDTAESITLGVVDPDIPYGDSHLFEIVSQPGGGAGAASISGKVLTFTPAANWNGSTSLTYRVRDSAGVWSAPATVGISVAAVNDAPVAQAKAFTTVEDTAGSVTLTATDIDSPVPAVFQVVTAPNPAHGSASASGNVLTFSPAADWSGVATLTYRAQDSAGAWSAPVTVTITVTPVNDPPTAVAKVLNMAEDGSGSVTLSVIDPDIPYGDTHAYQVVAGTGVGEASISGTTLTYTPDSDWNGSTSLTYRVRDAAGIWSTPVAVTINVSAVNDKPVAQAKSLSTPEDTVGQVTLTATDIDSPVPVVFELVGTVPASKGAAVISGNKLTFIPALNWNGVLTLSYRAQDTAGAWSNTVPISVTVASVNDAPASTGVPLVIRTVENVPMSIKVQVGN